ncbi:MAG TPA: anti-sigma factor antagonist [candidate division Zixibacteria bacterium]|nr:anti-sigma factor antagonist [candidate division Zixibacteria bacterium]
MSDFGITTKDVGEGIVVIKSAKLLDNNNAHEMVQAINAVQGRGIKFIIIDMTDLQFISSAGVGSILGTVESSREMGGDIVLAGPSETVIHVFRVLDLLDYLTIKGSEQEALAFCGAHNKV